MEKLSSKLGLHNGYLIHYCPACEDIHNIPVYTNSGKDWIMNGTINVPGVSPSIKIYIGEKVKCHYILEKGLINYCNDTTHKYTNQVIPLPDIPEQYWPKRAN